MIIYSTKFNYYIGYASINKIIFVLYASKIQASINHLKTHCKNPPINYLPEPLLTY